MSVRSSISKSSGGGGGLPTGGEPNDILSIDENGDPIWLSYVPIGSDWRLRETDVSDAEGAGNLITENNNPGDWTEKSIDYKIEP